MPIGSHQSARSVTDVWLTPPYITEALGGSAAFDLDPCAAVDQPWPTAREHFTVEDDGLRRPWHGNVWMNPPYSSPEIAMWMHRLAEHGHGIALIFARTETSMFHETVWRAASALLFFEGRLHFHVNERTEFKRKGQASLWADRGERAPANGGAPSVLCAYGAAAAQQLALSGLPGALVRQNSKDGRRGWTG